MRVIHLLLLLGTPFFFIGGPGAHGNRSFIALWDLGHVLFFSLTSLWLFQYFTYRLPNRSFSIIFITVFFIVLTLGFSIEGLQMCSGGRLPDIDDIARNQLGCLIAFVIWHRGKRNKIIVLQYIALILFIIALMPLVRGGIDEWIARSQFPVLSDFETNFEIDRWGSNGKLRIEKGIVRHGKQALLVQLTTDKYSSVSLKYFQGNWGTFNNLFFSIYLPDDKPLKIVCRVHDSAHTNLYYDRYNRSIIIKKGWNDLVISLAEVENSPRGRLLKLDEIEGFSFFVIKQEKERILYLDSVYLE